MLQNDRLTFLRNPLTAYLLPIANSIVWEKIDLWEILKDLPLDYLVIKETKLNKSFSNSQKFLQFKHNGYEIRYKRQEEIDINMEVVLFPC